LDAILVQRAETMSVARLSITRPVPVVEEIDRRVNHRSSFITAAVKAELARQKKRELQTSLRNPHSESEKIAEAGIAEWAATLPRNDWNELIQSAGGTPLYRGQF